MKAYFTPIWAAIVTYFIYYALNTWKQIVATQKNMQSQQKFSTLTIQSAESIV